MISEYQSAGIGMDNKDTCNDYWAEKAYWQYEESRRLIEQERAEARLDSAVEPVREPVCASRTFIPVVMSKPRHGLMRSAALVHRGRPKRG